MTRILLPTLTGAVLALAGCGGSHTAAPAVTQAATRTLTYVNPVQPSGAFALVQDPASTATRLVLDVVGPSGYASTGVTFSFDVDTSRAVWATAPAITNGTVFTSLGTGTQLVQAWVSGARLQGIVATKGLSNQVANVGLGVIATIVLTPAAGAVPGTVSLVDSGFGTYLDASGPPATPSQFAVGVLTCQ